MPCWFQGHLRLNGAVENSRINPDRLGLAWQLIGDAFSRSRLDLRRSTAQAWRLMLPTYATVRENGYNVTVARGWESKAVEEQMQLAQKYEGKRTGSRRERTAAQMEVERKRDSILLQRRRVMHDLEACTSDRYRKTLESGLAYLESQLELLKSDVN